MLSPYLSAEISKQNFKRIETIVAIKQNTQKTLLRCIGKRQPEKEAQSEGPEIKYFHLFRNYDVKGGKLHWRNATIAHQKIKDVIFYEKFCHLGRSIRACMKNLLPKARGIVSTSAKEKSNSAKIEQKSCIVSENEKGHHCYIVNSGTKQQEEPDTSLTDKSLSTTSRLLGHSTKADVELPDKRAKERACTNFKQAVLGVGKAVSHRNF